LKERTIAKHAAILATRQTMIHAMEGAVASEVAFSSWWRRRLAGAFRFPD
jgi:cell wall-associated NlpC family hydrolase